MKKAAASRAGGRTRPFRTVGIVAKTSNPLAVELAREAAAYLHRRGIEAIGDSRTFTACSPALRQATDDEMGRTADLMLVLGGDGTFIRAVSMISDRRIPVLGVNMGSLGFLTEITREELGGAMKSLLAGRYRLEERLRLRVRVVRGDTTVISHDVLNEVAVVKSALSPMINVDVNADGFFVNRFRGDGLLVCTPTGSTAYNLAADGPIVMPAMRCMVITPISPHMLADRPLVLPETTRISLKVPGERGQTFANMDGLRGLELSIGDEVHIEASPSPVVVVVPQSRDYFSILRSKLMWGAQ